MSMWKKKLSAALFARGWRQHPPPGPKRRRPTRSRRNSRPPPRPKARSSSIPRPMWRSPKARRTVPAEISRHRSSGRARRLGARLPAHRPGIFDRHLQRRCHRDLRRRAFRLFQARRAGWSRWFRRKSPTNGRPKSAIRTAISPPIARISPSWPTDGPAARGGGAEDMDRSARPAIQGQDGQGASGL